MWSVSIQTQKLFYIIKYQHESFLCSFCRYSVQRVTDISYVNVDILCKNKPRQVKMKHVTIYCPIKTCLCTAEACNRTLSLVEGLTVRLWGGGGGRARRPAVKTQTLPTDYALDQPLRRHNWHFLWCHTPLHRWRTGVVRHHHVVLPGRNLCGRKK